MYLQTGDVLYKQTDLIPSGAKKIKGDLVHKGENHHHRLSGGLFKILRDGDKTYLDIGKPTKAVHEEHKSVTLPKGKYVIDIVQEYDHFLEESRNVID